MITLKEFLQMLNEDELVMIYSEDVEMTKPLKVKQILHREPNYLLDNSVVRKVQPDEYYNNLRLNLTLQVLEDDYGVKPKTVLDENDEF